MQLDIHQNNCPGLLGTSGHNKQQSLLQRQVSENAALQDRSALRNTLKLV